MKYDAILVSTIYGKEIKGECEKNNIDKSKVIYCYGGCSVEDFNTDYEFVRKTLGEDFTNTIKNRYHLIRDIDADIFDDTINYKILTRFRKEKIYKSDYVRIRTFQLLVNEINKRNIEGAAAELGVFRGDFAMIINDLLPERTLYLFDTFEGFPKEEIQKELTGEVLKTTVDAYKKTSVDFVIKRMRFPEKIVIRQGMFPDTADGLDERFAFVSLDCDWEESLYQDLLFFYPRLSEGGYIMVHDYNNTLICAEKAIERYEIDNRCIMPKVPICDTQGRIILTKC